MRLALQLGLTRLALLCLTAFGPMAIVQAETTASSTAAAASSDAAAAQSKPKQFLYVLRLVPRLHEDQAWTEADSAATGRPARSKATMACPRSSSGAGHFCR